MFWTIFTKQFANCYSISLFSKMVFLNFEYTRTFPGVLKGLTVGLGILSLILISATFVPGAGGEQLLLVTVSACLVISTIYLFAYLRSLDLLAMKANHQLEFLFHAVAAFMLLLAGIDWVVWDDYSEVCLEECPPVFLVVLAKIVTFVNGTIYGIIAFLNTKSWKALSHGETAPLLDGSISDQP